MKRLVSLLLLCILLLSTFGFSINKHFCGGTLVSTQLIFTVNEDSCCGDQEPETGCCSDESTFIQLDNTYTLQKNNVEKNTYRFLASFITLFSIEKPSLTDVVLRNRFPDSPPKIISHLFSCLYCVLLI